MEHLIIKGIGPDKPGIVSNISKFVTSNNGNIEESRMIRLGSEFSIIMLITIPDGSRETLSNQLDSIEGIKFYLTPTRKLSSYEYPNYIISVEGADNEGIVHRVTDSIASLDINIIEVVTDTHNAPITGATLFHMTSKVYLKENSREQLEEKLSKIETEFGLVTKLEKI
tara:strand:+ start:1985 stop:2491 length:507 start_codon:yes stop_codon:yes gene_type:complete